MSTWEAVFTAARKLEKNDDWSAALECYSNIYYNGHQNDAALVYHFGYTHFRLNNLQEAQPLLEIAVGLEPDNARWRETLSSVNDSLAESNDVNQETAALTLRPSGAITEDLRTLSLQRIPVGTAQLHTGDHSLERSEAPRKAPAEPDLTPAAFPVSELGSQPDYSALAADHRRSGQRWQEINVLEAGLHLHRSEAAWHARLAEAAEAMNRPLAAAEAYESANRLDSSRPDLHFKEGLCWLRAGEGLRAAESFQHAVRIDRKLNASTYGIGVFYQQLGDWDGAAKAYEIQRQEQPRDANLAYRSALAYERCYQWDRAAAAYKEATAMNPSEAAWHYRRGFVSERMERWEEAAAAYHFGLSNSDKPSSYWAYRLGYVLEQLGRFEEACEFYRSTRPDLKENVRNDDGRLERLAEGYASRFVADSASAAIRNPSATASFAVAEKAESLGLWRQAAIAYQGGIDRENDVESQWHYRLGRALTRTGEYETAAVNFRMMRIFDDAHGVDTTGYRKNKALLDVMYYTSWRESLPIREDIVVYESFHGASISCNPLAIFEELRTRKDFANVVHVWVTNENTFIPRSLDNSPNVVLVRRNSQAYRKFLASAKYLVNNVTFPSYFVRRPEQQYLNTWHGTPLKTLGKDIKTGFLEHKNVARNFLQSTHLIVPNHFTAKILTERYDVDSLITAQIALTGYPRVDRTLNATELRREELLQELGIHSPGDKPVVLYAPTWRGGLDTTNFDVDRLILDLRQLAALDCHVVFRAHHRTQELLSQADLGVTIVPDSMETNDLLAVVDLLVTDYSSILFDFVPTRKPVVMYVYDVDDYSNERGLYLDPRDMPLAVATSIDDLCATIQEQLAIHRGQFTQPDELIMEYCPLDDGKSAARAVDFFFFADDSHNIIQTKAEKKTLLFHHSFIPNGITSSLLNLVSRIDPDEFNVIIVVPADETAARPERIEKLRELPPSVKVLGRVGRQLFTPEEKWIVDRLNKHKRLTNEEQWSIYWRAFNREFRRMFGAHEFTSVVEFEGYSTFWTSIMAAGSGESHRVAYLHNDMRSEWLGRFPHLEAIFKLYNSFDRLISVSEVISEENRSHLSVSHAIEEHKFVHAVNQVNPSRTLAMSQIQLDEDLQPWFTQNLTTFVTMGRMSPEKDHEKLIRAFSVFFAENQLTRLVVLGDGPLRSQLRQLITDLHLTDSVLLAGLRSNPFPALSRADCFVLSSNHEGQPMVLLEALTLGKPIISTDIIGAKYVLENGHGLLVENSQAGLEYGFRQFMEGCVPLAHFDISAYQEAAHTQFLKSAVV